MGAFLSGISGQPNSATQLDQQPAHNDFMRSLMQSMGSQGGSPLADTMSGPTQGPQLPAGGVSLQNMLMSKARTLPIMSLLKLGML